MYTIEQLIQLKNNREQNKKYNQEVAKKMAEMNLVDKKSIRQIAKEMNVSKSKVQRHISQVLKINF